MSVILFFLMFTVHQSLQDFLALPTSAAVGFCHISQIGKQCTAQSRSHVYCWFILGCQLRYLVLVLLESDLQAVPFTAF